MAKTKGKSPKAKPAKKTAKSPKSTPAPKSTKAPKSTRVTTKLPPAPPAPPPPPPPRDELPAPRDVGRLTRYGERFGPHKIDVRMWSAPGALQPTQLPVTSGALAIYDPEVPKSWRVFERPAGAGHFRIMLSISRTDDANEKLAAVVIHTGRPPIARWTVAHYKGQKKPTSADQLPRCPVTSGWIALVDAEGGCPGVLAVPPAAGIQPIEIPLTDGRHALALPCGQGEYVAYWAVDAQDKPICIVIDFDAFTQKEWKARSVT